MLGLGDKVLSKIPIPQRIFLFSWEILKSTNMRYHRVSRLNVLK